MPTPNDGMKTEAQRGLDWRSEHGRGGTEVGIARARDIVNGKNLSDDTVRRMYSFFSRHEVDKEAEGFSPGEDGYPSNGRIAWALWGGDAGYSWSKALVERMKKDEERAVADLTDNTRTALENKRDEHNEEVGDVQSKRVTLGMLTKVYERGVGAYKTNPDSVRPNVSSPEQWAMARVNSFLRAVKNEKFSSGKHDTDLFPEGHPLKSDGERNVDYRHIISVTEDEESVSIKFGKSESYEGIEPMIEENSESTEVDPGDNLEISEENQEVERFCAEEKQTRADDMQAEAIDDRTVRMAISSEQPVKRSFGMEVLDHSEESINLEFLNSGRAPLLLDHDPERQIGVIESVDLDGSARRLRATVRFGKNGLAREVYDDVVDKIRGNVSIGYAIEKMVRDESDKTVYRATQWRPMEASIVSIPADVTVGVGRKAEVTEEPKPEIPNVEITQMEEINQDQVRQDAAAARTKEISEILDIAAKHNQRDLADKAIREGATAAQFRGMLLDVIADKPMEQVDLGMNEKEVRQYSLMNAIRSASSGKFGGFEAEVSDELAKMYGKEARGFYVPTDIFKRDLVVGTDANGGFLKPTDHMGGEFIDALRANLVTSGLGARMMQGLKGDVAIPALNAKTSVGFVAENAAPGSEGAPTFRQVTLSPKTLVQYVDISRKLSMQSDPSVEQVIRNDMTAQFAAKIDEVAINGGGSNEPSGILQTSGIGSVAMGTNGGAVTYAKLVDLETEVAIDNALAGNLSFLTNPKVVGAMRQTSRQSSGVEGNFILNDANTLLGYGVASTSLVPSNLTKGTSSGVCSAAIFGNFSDLMIGMFGGLDVLVDPYTGSSTGATRIAMYQDIDVAVRHAESFAAIQDITTA